MITSKSDYKQYLKEDLIASELYSHRHNLLYRLTDKRFKFYKSLRLTEYYTNCQGGVLAKCFRFRHHMLCEKYGWTIPINVFGKGLAIVHSGTIVVSSHARIGEYCRIHVCVNIGHAISHGASGAPCIGNSCYIGPGAKIFGPINIGDNVAIGANAVVNKSFTEGNCTIAGIPARQISNKTSLTYIVKE